MLWVSANFWFEFDSGAFAATGDAALLNLCYAPPNNVVIRRNLQHVFVGTRVDNRAHAEA